MATQLDKNAETEIDFNALMERLRTRHMPITTYRLQLHAGFNFQQAKAIIPYLKKLGITDLYCSPYFASRPGSTHGYDLCDHNRLNPELGSEADYEEFVNELARNGMGHVLDFVPNHMGITPVGVNHWWQEVLENGSCSPYARYFDIDWEPIKHELKWKILLPILGDQYGQVLERGELKLGFADGTFHLNYYDHKFPINPRSSIVVHQLNLEALQAELSDEDPNMREYLSILTSLRNLPTYIENDEDLIAERHREKEVARDRLRRLIDAAPRILQHIEANIAVYNGEPGKPESFDLLHELLETQAYRLAYWRTAAHEINYRRFFDINELAAVRMEDAKVFESSHALLLRLIREGKITGLRLDHIDGLFDPFNYLEMLQQAILCEWASDLLSPDEKMREDLRVVIRAWREQEKSRDQCSPAVRPFYVVAEKILSHGELLPDNWALYGTSGYDFLNDLNGIFIDSRNEEAMKKIYTRFTGEQHYFPDIVYKSKKRIMWSAMASELNVLAFELNRISERNRNSRDFTLNSLRDALIEVVACFFKYRSYINQSGYTDSDRETIMNAVMWAKRRNPIMEKSIFDFISDVLLTTQNDGIPPEEYRRRLQFAMKFQQYTAPVQAKGFEDTAFYRYNMLLSLNEVGGEPQRFGRSRSEFHGRNLHRLERWPYGMLNTATHDTKRGEDVRARLNVLSEIPDEFGWELSKWDLLNANKRTVIHEDAAPDRNDEYLLYQTMLGFWPCDDAPREQIVERLRAYMIKALREAKVHTSWINENRSYEEAVTSFIEKILLGDDAENFLDAFMPFQQRIAQLGMVNSLSQVILKIVSPGVPDFYQGTELWDLSLVDPDNRRAVDFEARERMLDELEAVFELPAGERLAAIADMLANWQDGRIKLFITTCGLRLRRTMAELFARGAYIPLSAEPAINNNIVALARKHNDDLFIAIVPRLITALTTPEHRLPISVDTWKTARLLLPEDVTAKSFRNLFTGEQTRPLTLNGQAGIFIAEALRTCPVAILVGEK